MNRRDFLHVSAMAACSGVSRSAWGLSDPAPDDWHTYEVTTSVTVRPDQGPTRIWLPAPLPQRTAFQRTLSTSIDCPTGKAHQTQNANASMVCAQFPAGAAPTITVTNRVATRNWAVPLAQPNRSVTSSESGEDVSLSHALRSHRRRREGARRQHHQGADLRRSTRRVRSTSGSSRTPTAIPRFAAAESVTSAPCSRTATSEENALTSTHSSSAS